MVRPFFRFFRVLLFESGSRRCGRGGGQTASGDERGAGASGGRCRSERGTAPGLLVTYSATIIGTWSSVGRKVSLAERGPQPPCSPILVLRPGGLVLAPLLVLL